MGHLAWKLFGQQAAGLSAFFAAYLLSGFLTWQWNLALALVLGIGAFIGYIICNSKDFLDGLWLFPILFSAASGFAVGIYFCRFDSLFFWNFPTLLLAYGISLCNALLQYPGTGVCARWQKIAAGAVAAGTLALSIACFCNWGAGLALREGAFVLLFLFILLFGEFFYVWLGGDVRHKMSLAFCAAFFVVLFVVLLVVTEGDIADGIGDAFVGGSAGEKKRKRRGRLK